jgi:hypothetical protein
MAPLSFGIGFGGGTTGVGTGSKLPEEKYVLYNYYYY